MVFSARLAFGGEVLSIASDVSSNISSAVVRVATGSRDKCIQVWEFDASSRKLTTIFSKAHGTERDIVPKAMAFYTNSDKDILVFGYNDGGMWVTWREYTLPVTDFELV